MSQYRDYYYHHDDYKSQSQLDAERKNKELARQLANKRSTFAGIGTNKAKRRLNKLGLTDHIAKAVRLALEIEDKNISAKQTYGEYRSDAYEAKYGFIIELAKLFQEHGMTFGIEETDNFSATHVIYFDIPGCEQVSWHFSPKKAAKKFPTYPHKWDGLINSTLLKLEKIAIVLLSDQPPPPPEH